MPARRVREAAEQLLREAEFPEEQIKMILDSYRLEVMSFWAFMLREDPSYPGRYRVLGGARLLPATAKDRYLTVNVKERPAMVLDRKEKIAYVWP